MKVEVIKNENQNANQFEKGHYFPKDVRRTEEVKVRFSPAEMKVIKNVMAAMKTQDKLSKFLWRVVMSSICRKREELIQTDHWEDE